MGKNLTVALAVIAAAASISGCFGTNDNDGGGRLIEGGGGGSGGSSGSNGTAGAAGASGSGVTGGGTGGSSSGGSAGGGPLGNGSLGSRCASDAECGEGLTCLTATSTELGGAPPGGLCTTTCTSHDVCLQHAADAWCVAGETGDYCFEGCSPDSATDKCQGRPEVVCHALDVAPTGQACSEGAGCDPGAVCLDGECNVAVTACLPQCGSDADCTGGLFCDQRSGLCVATAPQGKDFNEPCDPSAAADPEECVSFCSESYADPEQGTCSGFCNLGHPFSCGYDGEGVADSACLFATVLGGEEPELGDLGLCGQLCDCNSDCNATGDYCLPFEDSQLEELWQRDGYCAPIVEGSELTPSDSLDCGAGVGGAGGAGGAP